MPWTDYLLDDAAASALYSLQAAPQETLGLLFENNGELKSTLQASPEKHHARATLQFNGKPRALVHNHPLLPGKYDHYATRFSPDDISQARRLQLPSYLVGNGKLMRFDPKTSKQEEVLAQFPIEEWKKLLSIKTDE